MCVFSASTRAGSTYRKCGQNSVWYAKCFDQLSYWSVNDCEQKVKVLTFWTISAQGPRVLRSRVTWSHFLEVLHQNKICYHFFLRIVRQKKMKFNLRVLLSILFFIAAKSGKFRGHRKVTFFVLFWKQVCNGSCHFIIMSKDNRLIAILLLWYGLKTILHMCLLYLFEIDSIVERVFWFEVHERLAILTSNNFWQNFGA